MDGISRKKMSSAQLQKLRMMWVKKFMFSFIFSFLYFMGYMQLFSQIAVTGNLFDIQTFAGVCWKDKMDYRIRVLCWNSNRWSYKSVQRKYAPVLGQPLYKYLVYTVANFSLWWISYILNIYDSKNYAKWQIFTLKVLLNRYLIWVKFLPIFVKSFTHR